MIPKHTVAGRLPAGEHRATWAEFAARFSGTPKRDMLVRCLRGLLVMLADAGCETVYVGGSFVTSKAQPGDVDLAWAIAGVDEDHLHPMFLAPDAINAIRAMFGVHCFPADVHAGDGMTYREFFQHDRDGEPVGVVVLDLTTL